MDLNSPREENRKIPEQVPEQVLEQVLKQVPEQVLEQVLEQVPEKVLEQVPEQGPEQASEQVPEQVLEQTPKQFWEKILKQVFGQVPAQYLTQVQTLQQNLQQVQAPIKISEQSLEQKLAQEQKQALEKVLEKDGKREKLNDIYWVGSWGRPLVRALTEIIVTLPPIYRVGLLNQTLRQITHLSKGGTKLRLRFQSQSQNSETSQVVVPIAEVRVARQALAQAIVPGTDTLVTFNNGQIRFEIYPGGEVISDPINFVTQFGENLAVSMYCNDPSGPPPGSYNNLITEYLANPPGNLTSAITFDLDPTSPQIQGPLWLSGVDVYDDGDRRDKCKKDEEGAEQETVICFGDSITAGATSTRNAYLDYPSQLSNRFNNELRDRKIGVLNEGISGNQISSGGIIPLGIPPIPIPFPIFGASFLERMNRDVFNQTNVKFVIILGGINDIALSDRTANQVINGLKQIFLQIKANNPETKVFFGTITPFKDNTFGTWTIEREAVRQEVNEFILSYRPIDGVFDFSRTLQDPIEPLRIRPELTNDGLHPNDNGYKAMAFTVNLKKFR